LTSPPRKRRWPRRLLAIVTGLAVCLLALWLLRFPIFGGILKRAVARAVEERGVQITVEGISGTLVTDVELTGIRVEAAPGRPAIREASVRRVRATYSLVGLLLGDEDWVHEVEVSGARAVLDLGAPPPPPRPERPPAERTPTLPGRFVLEDLELVVFRGEERLELEDVFAEARAREGDAFDGSFGADRFHLVAAGEDRRGGEIRGTYAVSESVLAVDRVTVDGTEHTGVFRADFRGLDEGLIEAEFHALLLGGRVDLSVELDVSGERPRGDAEIELSDLDPRELLGRHFPDAPLDVARVSGRALVRFGGDGEPDLDDLHGSFEFEVREPSYSGRGCELLEIEGTLEEGQVAATGRLRGPAAQFSGTVSIEEPLAFSADVRCPDLDLGALDLSPVDLRIGGRATIGAHVEGTAADPAVSLYVDVTDPRWGDRGADRLAVKANGWLDDIRVERVELARVGDRLVASGWCALGEEEGVVFRGTADVKIGAIEHYVPWLPPGVPQDLAGSMTIRAAVPDRGTPRRPAGRVEIEGRGIVAAGHAARHLALTARMASVESVAVERLDVTGAGDLPRVRIEDATVDYGGGGVDVRARSLEGTWREHEFASTDEVRFAARDRVLSARLPLAAQGASLDASGTIDEGIDLAARVVVEGFDLSVLGKVIEMPFPAAGTARAEVRAEGTLDAPALTADVTVMDLRVTPPGREEIRAESLRFRAAFRDGEGRIENLSLLGPDFGLTASGSIPVSLEEIEAARDAPLEGRAVLADVPLTVSGPLPGLERAKGRISADLDISGSLTDPRVTGSVSVRAEEVELEDPRVPPIRALTADARVLGLSLWGGGLRIERAEARVLDGDVLVEEAAVTYRDGALIEPSLSLRATSIQIAELSRSLGGEAAVAGRADVALTVTPEPVVTVAVTGPGLTTVEGFAGDLFFEGVWRDGVATVSRGSFTAEGRHFSLAGSVPVALTLDPPGVSLPDDRELALTVVSSGWDVGRLLATVLGERVPELEVSGPVSLEFFLGGTWSSLSPRGQARLSEGRLRHPDAPPITDVAATITGVPDPSGTTRIEIAELSGKLGTGTFTASGGADLVGFKKLENLGLTLKGSNLLLLREENLVFRSNARLHLDGPTPDDLLLSGDLEVRRLRFTGDVEELRLFRILTVGLADVLRRGAGGTPGGGLFPLPLTQDPHLGKVRLDLRVRVPEESFVVRNNLADAVLAGEVKVTGTVAMPRPEGRLRVIDGDIHLPTLTMTIDDATATFRKDAASRPDIALRMSATISDYEVYVGAAGTYPELRATLSSDPGLPEEDILSLITTGVTRSQLGSEAAGGVAATVLYRQLRSELSGGGDDESFLSRLAQRTELEVDTSTTRTGGTPTISATIRLSGRWLFMRVQPTDPLNYGLDLIFRLSYK
jgi:hypothetical protein